MESTSTTTSDFEDLAKGCIFGAFIGDALGSYLEFQSDIRSDELDKAMTMPGGGPFYLGAGQITDDSELALCLGHGLVEGKGVLDLNKIANQYKKWIESPPFDVGQTIGTAVRIKTDKVEEMAYQMRKKSNHSYSSQSNGAMMRITPMCIWASKLSRDDLIRAVYEETRLTHPNKAAKNASIVYAYVVQHLLHHKGDYKGAYEKCEEMIECLDDGELRSWISDVNTGEEKLPRADKMIGWVRIAFSYSMFFLKNNMNYTEALRSLLKRGGDTDTNLCIAGGILGALHGFKKLPQEYVKKVIEFEPTEEEGRDRPDFLIPKKCVLKMISELIKIIPSTLKMEGEEKEEEREDLPNNYFTVKNFIKM